nr:uncharacterized protein LOC133621285 [Nerophis lumbriciformis]
MDGPRKTRVKFARVKQDACRLFKRKSSFSVKYLIPAFLSLALLELVFVQALTQVVMPLMSDTMNISQPSNETTTTTTTTPSQVSSTRIPVTLPGTTTTTTTTTTPSQVSSTRIPVTLPGTTTKGSTTTNNGQSQPSFSTSLFVVLFALPALWRCFTPS